MGQNTLSRGCRFDKCVQLTRSIPDILNRKIRMLLNYRHHRGWRCWCGFKSSRTNIFIPIHIPFISSLRPAKYNHVNHVHQSSLQSVTGLKISCALYPPFTAQQRSLFKSTNIEVRIITTCRSRRICGLTVGRNWRKSTCPT